MIKNCSFLSKVKKYKNLSKGLEEEHKECEKEVEIYMFIVLESSIKTLVIHCHHCLQESRYVTVQKRPSQTRGVCEDSPAAPPRACRAAARAAASRAAPA